MKVIVYGGSGMIGGGVIRACLQDNAVTEILSVGRAPLAIHAAKLQSCVMSDMLDYSAVMPTLVGYDACFYCLGVSSLGLDEDAYTRITYAYTMAAAHALLAANPRMTFIFVSGSGADSSERGRTMWARVKGKTENALFKLPFRAVYVFRPSFVQPVQGATSRTTAYRVIYGAIAPLMPALRVLFPKSITTTDKIGRAMLALAKGGGAQTLLHNADINAVTA